VQRGLFNRTKSVIFLATTFKIRFHDYDYYVRAKHFYILAKLVLVCVCDDFRIRLNGGHADLWAVWNLTVDLGGATVTRLKMLEQYRLATEGAFLAERKKGVKFEIPKQRFKLSSPQYTGCPSTACPTAAKPPSSRAPSNPSFRACDTVSAPNATSRRHALPSDS
jgi:hypothetical protein